MRRSPARNHLLSGILLVFGAMLFSGCVHRRMTIESNPVGALVLLDGKEIGYTPISHDFTYYGTREVTLIKDGYETQTYSARLRTPWYQHVPLDFFTDNFLLFPVTNRHRFRFQMRPKDPVTNSDENLLQRGNSFRSEALISP